MDLSYESELLEKAVTELSRLPGIGRKTALRLSLHLLRQDEQYATDLGSSIINLRKGVVYCKQCHNISQTDICPICSDISRDLTTICVVENVKDVMSFENTRQYKGVYHVLGGLISPIDGVGPDQLEIKSLIERVQKGEIKEVILALSATMEGDTTCFFIYKQLLPYNIRITQIARGVSIGNEIEYTDEITLGRSIVSRTPFADQFVK